MNCIRTLFRRLPGNVIGLANRYHNGPHICDTRYSLVGKLKNEQNISRLIQKTIIPLNIVKPKPAILDLPCTNIIGKINNLIPEKIDQVPTKEIIDPSKTQEKKAHRMLIIKRKKMNKHKYKKMMRKNKFRFAKKKRERKMAREVAFRHKIVEKLKTVEKFNAEAYVAEKLEIYRKEILPARLHGKIMPEWVIQDALERKEVKKQYIANIRERRRRFIALRGSLDVEIRK